MENFDDKYKKKNPFTVPDGYFDDLTERVMRRVEEKKTRKKVRFFRSYMGWAAVLVGALFVTQVLYTVITDRGAAESVAYGADGGEKNIFDSHFNPTSDEIIEYLASEMDDCEWMIAGIY
ncbi:MAG: hypothetical protein K2M86_04355 [Odoribacter sp.]|nr:hypothetical protein [Odoribacter sp.]